MRTALGMDPKGDDDVIIVTVDEKSVNKLGRWPWDRTVIGELFARLDKAEIVGLDIVFSEQTEREKDLYLAERIEESGNIILGFFFREQASEETSAEDVDLIQECSYYDYELLDKTVGVKEFAFSEINIPVLSDAALSCAYFNTDPEMDGLYRRYPLAYVHQGYIFPPLAIQMLRNFLNKDANIVFNKNGIVRLRLGEANVKRSNHIRLNFYDTESIRVVPAVNIMNGTVHPDFFAGKIVLVGVTEIAVFDMRPTPINPVTPGVLLHYAAFLNLLRNEMLLDAQWLDILLMILIVGAALLISFRHSFFERLVWYILLIVVGMFFPHYIFWTHHIWLREFYFIVPVLINIAALESAAFVYTEMKAGELKRAFSSYVSPEVVREILQNPDRLTLGGEEREISILFSDIRKFTSLSEKVSPAKLVQILNQIHDPMTQIVLASKGMLDKYIGDAMMALFNTPVNVPDHPDKAVACGLEMVRKLARINNNFVEQGLPAIDLGVGINSGKCIVGNMGSRLRFEYTAIGDTVNLASRLEGLCKTYRTRIVISEYTKKRLTLPFLTRKLDKVTVKGKSVPVEVFEVMEDSLGNRRIKDGFEMGLEKYFAKNFEEALSIFEQLVQEYDDGAAKVFAQRCQLFILKDPGQSWDGVFALQSK